MPGHFPTTYSTMQTPLSSSRIESFGQKTRCETPSGMSLPSSTKSIAKTVPESATIASGMTQLKSSPQAINIKPETAGSVKAKLHVETSDSVIAGLKEKLQIKTTEFHKSQLHIHFLRKQNDAMIDELNSEVGFLNYQFKFAVEAQDKLARELEQLKHPREEDFWKTTQTLLATKITMSTKRIWISFELFEFVCRIGCFFITK